MLFGCAAVGLRSKPLRAFWSKRLIAVERQRSAMLPNCQLFSVIFLAFRRESDRKSLANLACKKEGPFLAMQSGRKIFTLVGIIHSTFKFNLPKRAETFAMKWNGQKYRKNRVSVLWRHLCEFWIQNVKNVMGTNGPFWCLFYVNALKTVICRRDWSGVEWH